MSGFNDLNELKVMDMVDKPPREIRRRKRRLTDETKKMNKLISDRKYQKRKRESLRSSVNIFGQITRWQDFKTANRVEDDEQAAQMLLDHYESWKLQAENTTTTLTEKSLKTHLSSRGKPKQLVKNAKHKISIATTSKPTPTDQNTMVPIYLSQWSSVHETKPEKCCSEEAPITCEVVNEENGQT